MSLRNWLLLFCLSLLWAGAFLFAKVAVQEILPIPLVFMRVAIAAITLHAVMKTTGQSFPWRKQELTRFAIMGLLNNIIPFTLLFWGQTQIAAGLASVLNATTPIFAFLIAGVWQRQEPVTSHRTLGVLAGFLGVALMLSANLKTPENLNIVAQLACLGAALSYGCAAAFAKTFRSIPPLTAATGQLTGSTLLLLPVAAVTAGSWSPTNTSLVVWGNVLALGIFATALAYLIYFRLLANAGATNAALVTLLIPATTILFGYLLLGERLQTLQLSGFGALLLGLLFLDGRAFRIFRHQKP